MTIRFHLDEHIHPGIGIGLRARGIDVTTTADVHLSGRDDLDHFGIVCCHLAKYEIGERLRLYRGRDRSPMDHVDNAFPLSAAGVLPPAKASQCPFPD